MKKIYNAPEMNIQLIYTEDILTLSSGGDNGSTLDPVNFSDLFDNL